MDEDRLQLDSRPFVEVKLMGVVFLDLLDTGSVVNLVGRRVAEHLRRQGVEPCRQATPLRMADGSRSNTEFSFRLSGESAGRRWVGDAFYVPTLTTEMILGVEVIKELGLVTVGKAVVCMGVDDYCSGHVGCLDSVGVSEKDPVDPADVDTRVGLVVEARTAHVASHDQGDGLASREGATERRLQDEERQEAQDFQSP